MSQFSINFSFYMNKMIYQSQFSINSSSIVVYNYKINKVNS